MRLIIDSDKAKMPRNCHECYLCYGGWCTVMPSEEDEMCPDRDRPEWCPLSVAPDAIPVEWLLGKALDAEQAIYYCKGDAKKNAEIMSACRLIMALWEEDGA